MAATTNMKIILGQGNAIHEVHSVRKQNLELNQQFVANETEGKKREDKAKVQEFEVSDKVVIQEDDQKRDKKNPKAKRKGLTKRKSRRASLSSGGNRIDIRV